MADEVRECPFCCTRKLRETIEDTPCGGIAAGLSVKVPVVHCDVCHESWTDYRAEDAEQALIEQIEKPEPWTRADHEQMTAIADYYEEQTRRTQ